MPRISVRRALAALAAVLVTLAAGGTVALVIDGDGGVRVVTQPNSVTPAERQLPVTPTPEQFDSGEPGAPLSSSDAPGKSEAEERALERQHRQEAREDNGDVAYDTSRVLEGAAGRRVTERNCHTKMNGGSRAISRILLGVGHVTVSRNVAGTRDGEAICSFFQRVKASSTWIVDNEGNSWENVPLSKIPWTQVFYNGRSCSIEYIGSTGRPGEGPAEWTVAQLREGGRLFAKCFAAAKIPARMAIVRSSGVIVQSGFTTHQELGSLGGGHTDPGPFFRVAAQLHWIRFYTRGPRPNTAAERRDCNALSFHRQRVRSGSAAWSDTVVNRQGHRLSRGRHAGGLKRALRRGGVDVRHCR